MGAYYIHPLGIIGWIKMNAVGSGVSRQKAFGIGKRCKAIEIPAVFFGAEIVKYRIKSLHIIQGKIAAIDGFLGAYRGEGQDVNIGGGLQRTDLINETAIGLGKILGGHTDLVDAELYVHLAVLLAGQSFYDCTVVANLIGYSLLINVVKTYSRTGEPVAGRNAAIEIQTVHEGVSYKHRIGKESVFRRGFFLQIRYAIV